MMDSINSGMLLSMIIAPILIKMAEAVVGWLSAITDRLITYIKRRNSLAQMTLVSNSDRYGRSYGDLQILKVITSISKMLIKKGCTIRINQLSYDGGYNTQSLETVKYKGYEFRFDIVEDSQTNGTDRTLTTVTKLVITHANEHKIRRLVGRFTTRIMNKSDHSFRQKFYGQTKTKDCKTVHRTLEFSPDTTFDDIFFPQKQQIMDSLDALMAGRLRKLGLYLHGEPGCGKSSLVKAIAAKTGYSIVEIKLSCVETDDELRKIVFDRLIYTMEGGDCYYRAVDVSRRIYLFEDIDADCDIVYKRSEQAPKKPASKLPASVAAICSEDSAKKDKDFWPKIEKLTLSGILNVLDGIIAISGIVIITTNHPEKLDPALIRFGRMTYNIKMERMRADCAGALVRKFHGEFAGTVPDMKYTPSELEAICQTNSSADVARILSAEVMV